MLLQKNWAHNRILAFNLAILGSYLINSVPVTSAELFSKQRPFAHTQVALVLGGQEIRPGQSLDIAVHFKLDKGWHIYGKESGDLGLPTEVRFNLPSGASAEEPRWPLPQVFESDGLVSYGYENELFLPARIQLPSSITHNTKLAVDLSWVLCNQECQPGKTSLELDLSDTQQLAKAVHPELFEAARLAAKNTGEVSLSNMEFNAALLSVILLASFAAAAIIATQRIAPSLSIKLKALRLDNFNLMVPAAQKVKADSFPKVPQRSPKT